MRTIRISWLTREWIKACAETAEPREACGLLVKNENGSVGYIPTRNDSKEELEYSVNPDDHLRIMMEREVVGVLHSHVKVGAELSGVDRAMMVGGFVYAIYSVANDELLAWRLVGDVVEFVAVVVESE